MRNYNLELSIIDGIPPVIFRQLIIMAELIGNAETFSSTVLLPAHWTAFHEQIAGPS